MTAGHKRHLSPAMQLVSALLAGTLQPVLAPAGEHLELKGSQFQEKPLTAIVGAHRKGPITKSLSIKEQVDPRGELPPGRATEPNVRVRGEPGIGKGYVMQRKLLATCLSLAAFAAFAVLPALASAKHLEFLTAPGTATLKNGDLVKGKSSKLVFKGETGG